MGNYNLRIIRYTMGMDTSVPNAVAKKIPYGATQTIPIIWDKPYECTLEKAQEIVNSMWPDYMVTGVEKTNENKN